MSEIDRTERVVREAAERVTHVGQSIGVDVVDIPRFEALIAKWGRSFLERSFTAREIEYCSRKSYPAQHFAGTFAAKEAVFKALKLRWESHFSWRMIEIFRDEHGRPRVLMGPQSFGEHVAPRRRSTGYEIHIDISLSHEKEMAIAVASAVR